MIDENYIETILQKGKEAKEKVHQEFAGLSFAQLNWKYSADSWSIGQCLEHLMASHNTYFPDLNKITRGTYKMSFWERHSPFTTICGKIMKHQLQEQVIRKMKAPKKIRPGASKVSEDVVDRYLNNLDSFLEYLSDCQYADIDKTIITSPIIGIVTYTLRDAFQFLLQHEHRHINQALRVKTNQDFPG